jgi:peptide/nickel transport system substrate-binding protein
MKHWFVFIGLILLVALLGACASRPTPSVDLTPEPTHTAIVILATATPNKPLATPTPSSRRGGEFKQAVAQDAKSFHVYQTTDATSRMYQELVYASGLTLRDPKTLQPIPGMAQAWKVSDDGRTYTFTLRQDLKWSDGTPLTAYDFEWTYSMASNPENLYPYLDTFRDIASYRAKDDYTLEIVLREALCTGLQVVDSITPLPQHVWSKYSWSDPAKNPEIQNPTVVSGPYKLKEWKPGNSVAFVRNDLYYRGAPNFDSYTVRIAANPATQLQWLKSGEVDTAPVSLADFAEAKKLENLRLYQWETEMPEWEFIGLNLRRAFLQDVQVRRALAYAIPRQTIADQVFQGLAKPLFSNIAPSSWAFNPDVPRYDYNIETAKATLLNAGYKLDANNRLLGKDGKPVPRLKIFYNLTNERRKQIATIAQTEFKKLGIDSEVIGMDFDPYLDYLKKEPYDYDLYILGWRTLLDPYYGYQVWSEASIPGLNTGAYVNREVEKLYTQANRPPCEVDARKKTFAQIQQILANDVPYVFLVYRTDYAFINKRIAPNEPTKLGITYAPEQWYVVR